MLSTYVIEALVLLQAQNYHKLTHESEPDSLHYPKIIQNGSTYARIRIMYSVFNKQRVGMIQTLDLAKMYLKHIYN